MINVNDLPTVLAGLDTSICIYDSIVLNGSGAQSYNWSGGIVDSIPFVPDSNSIYTVIGIDTNGCQNTDSIEISIIIPLVDAGLDQEICIGDSVLLVGLGNNISWSSSVIDLSLIHI